MKTTQRAVEPTRRDRPGERGAALITALLLSVLLLTLGGALIVATTTSATNSVDAMPEAQAYYGAETGLQSALYVLRGNAAPAPTFVPMTSPVPDANKLSFRGAVTPSISNRPGDPTTAGFPNRLSRWIAYNYTPAGFAYADRVAVSSGTYTPASGVAYSLAVTDPDNSHMVTYFTSAVFSGGGTSLTVPAISPPPVNSATITYIPQATTPVSAAAGVSSGLGVFRITRTGTGALFPAGSQVSIRIAVSAPFSGYVILNGTITGRVTQTSSTVKIIFSNISARVNGTVFRLSANPLLLNATVGSTSPFPDFPLQATITAPDPRNLLVTSTGYGPQGARKILQMLVGRYGFYLDPPAPIVIRGSDNTADPMTFDLGTSNAKLYTGKDFSGKQVQLPAIAIRLHDWTAGYGGVSKGSTVVDPKFAILDIDTVPNAWPAYLTPVPSNVPKPNVPTIPQQAKTPDFLRTADDARKFLNELQAEAVKKGRYYASFSGYASSGNNAATKDSPELTFVDGNCTLDGGSGLLIVTGTLTLNGNDDFKGVILVLGGGRVIRAGTGNGRVLGSWMVAAFPRTGNGGFTAPSYNVSGGGSGAFQFDSTATDDAQRTIGSQVLGVAER
jgi:hypothetical protein